MRNDPVSPVLQYNRQLECRTVLCCVPYLVLTGFSPVLCIRRRSATPLRSLGMYSRRLFLMTGRVTSPRAPPDPDSVNRDSVYSNTHGVVRTPVLTVINKINNTWFKRVGFPPCRLRQLNAPYASTHRYGFCYSMP